MSKQSYKQAIQAARQELADVTRKLQEYAELKTRQVNLEKLIQNLQRVMGETEAEAPPRPASPPRTNGSTGAATQIPVWRDAEEAPVWKHIQAIMRETKKSMSAQEVLDALNERGITPGGAHPRETVRAAMWRKMNDVFVKDGTNFRLREETE